jgi:predicted Zn-dependent peptidase
MTRAAADELLLVPLASGVRVLLLPLPHAAIATVAVYLRSGSAHESRRDSGISHFVEHMVFKGTAQRDAHRINLDAERLGAEVNAHTDKDHSAFHIRGLPEHAEAFVHMLAEIVLQPSFPADELERERQVLLQEHAEDEDDPVATAFKLFDRACYGTHPVAQPVIGPRRHVERFTRAELQAWMGAQTTAPNLVLALAGPFDAAQQQALLRAAEAAFAAAPRGTPNAVPPAPYVGGIASQRQDGSSQTHLVLGFPIPPLALEDPATVVAAALFGDGMSSPLMQGVREQRGLAYYAGCSADVLDMCGQFVVEASTAPAQFDELLGAVLALLRRQADHIDAVDLERARNQLAVRHLRAQERPLRRLEAAALELFSIGRLRAPDLRLQALRDVGAGQVRQAFATMLQAGASVAVTGQVARGTRDRVRQLCSA